MARARLLLFAALVGAPGCATPPGPAPSAPLAAEVTISYRSLFGGGSSQSIYDPRGLGAGRMDRVLVEEPALQSGEVGVEGWLRRRLFQALGQRGSVVLAPPPGACLGPPCAKLAPTAALRNLRLAAGKDHLRVRVTRDANGRPSFELANDPKAESLCDPGLELPIHFVQLGAQVQSLPEGAIVGELSELSVVEAPEPAELTLRVPSPEEAPEAFCRAAAAAYVETPGFGADDERYDRAARRAIELALSGLYPEPSPPP